MQRSCQSPWSAHQPGWPRLRQMEKLIMPLPVATVPLAESPAPKPGASSTAFGCPREFLHNRFVYVVVSPRARGLSIGVNMNPDKHCNFDCAYCEVNRLRPSPERALDVDVMADELQQTLALAHA